MKIASLPEERWVMKAAGWNPERSMKYKTYRVVGRPKKRWEDERNDFLRPERTEDEINNVERNNNVDQDSKKSRRLEENGKQVRDRGRSTAQHRTLAQKENG